MEYVLADHESLLYAGREAVADALGLLADAGGDTTPFFSGNWKMRRAEAAVRTHDEMLAAREESLLMGGYPKALKVESAPELGLLILTLSNQRRFVLQLERVKELATATPEQLTRVELVEDGTWLYFPDLDLEFWVPGLSRGMVRTRHWMMQVHLRGMAKINPRSA